MIAETHDDAAAEIDAMFGGAFGTAGHAIVIEEFMQGEEASFFALCDGETRAPLRHGARSQARRRGR